MIKTILRNHMTPSLPHIAIYQVSGLRFVFACGQVCGQVGTPMVSSYGTQHTRCCGGLLFLSLLRKGNRKSNVKPFDG